MSPQIDKPDFFTEHLHAQYLQFPDLNTLLSFLYFGDVVFEFFTRCDLGDLGFRDVWEHLYRDFFAVFED